MENCARRTRGGQGMERMQRSPESLSLEIYDWGYAKKGPEWCSDVINPPFSRLYFILGGDAYFQYGNCVLKQPFHPRICYLLPANLTFRYACETQIEQMFFHIALTRRNGQDILRHMGKILACPYSEELLRTLKNALSTSKLDGRLQVQACLMQVLAAVFSANEVTLPQKEYTPCVERVLSYIHTHPSASLSLEKLAELAFVSQTTLSKWFRREVGMTVREYIDEIIFTQAQVLLRNSKLSIAAISEQLDFCDQFYFSRRFRQRYQQSPRDYRKSGMI
jgi:AraC-like DNA-binding protein